MENDSEEDTWPLIGNTNSHTVVRAAQNRSKIKIDRYFLK